MRFFFLLFFFSTLCAYNIKHLTLEEKVGQLIMAYFDGEDLNEYGRDLIIKAHLGSYIYYEKANGRKNPEQMRSFTKSLQQCAQKNHLPPLLIAVDQEGGIVSTLKDEFTSFPGNGALGKADDTNLAYLTGLYQGQELRYAGINLNLAPVVDVNCNKENPIIGVRSFSQDPNSVLNFALKMIEGYEKAKLFYCLKHFPGHGDVKTDSHIDLPIVDKSYTQLKNTELFPYYSLAKKAPFIMTAHILFPQIDKLNPATLSPKIIQEILRKEIGFEGVIIADSLRMKGILPEGKDIGEVAIEAINAGCDLLCIGGEFLEGERRSPAQQIKDAIYVHDQLIQAVVSGKISKKRIDESVERILKLKEKSSLLFSTSTNCNQIKAQEVATKTSEHSFKIINDKLPLLINKKILIYAPNSLASEIQASPLSKLGKQCTITFFDPKTGDKDKNINIDQFDSILFLSLNAWKSESQKELIETLSQKRSTTLVALRDPNDLDVLSQPEFKIATFSPSKHSLEYVAKILSQVQY